jgi:hypothetical protein
MKNAARAKALDGGAIPLGRRCEADRISTIVEPRKADSQQALSVVPRSDSLELILVPQD